MSTFYDIDRANARLPEVGGILEHLRERRLELIALRDRLLVAQRHAGGSATGAGGSSDPGAGAGGIGRSGRDRPDAGSPGALDIPGGEPGSITPDAGLHGDHRLDPDSPRMLEARIRAVVDQMEAGVGRLVDLGIQLREIERGLIDFPALSAGRPIWLCWELGEGDEIHFWHEHNAGYASRRPLIELT